MVKNHRVLAHVNNNEVYFQIHEVDYTDNVATSYTINPITVGGNDLNEIAWTLNKMQDAIKKPIIWSGDRFPNICRMKYTCVMCNRNTFDKPSAHKCQVVS